jgi:hypothetical protein
MNLQNLIRFQRSIYYPEGCEASVPDHICDPCAVPEHGRVRSVAFIKSSFSFTDPTDPNEWITGIDNRDIIVIPEVLGSFDGGAPVESPGYGDQSTKITGYNFSLLFKDPNYRENAAFFNGIKNARNYKVAWRTETQTHISDNTVSVVPKQPVTEDLASEVVWDVEVKFAQADLAEPFDTPVGIFDQCLLVTA